MTNSGDLDGEFTYLYNGNQIIEVRNGADDVELLVVHGTRYIDEIVCQRVKDRGWAYVHQDANWNVTALTAMNGAVIERYWYKPYGEFVAAAEYGWFDYDQDGDVDGTDVAAAGLGGACWQSSSQACLCLDADGDGKVEYDDYAIISAYVSTLTADTQLQRVPAAPSTRRGNPFAHQGLLYDAEIASYQNRARQYDPKAKRFIQRDPLQLMEHSPKIAMALEGLDINSYSYVGNEPLSCVDPLGLSRPRRIVRVYRVGDHPDMTRPGRMKIRYNLKAPIPGLAVRLNARLASMTHPVAGTILIGATIGATVGTAIVETTPIEDWLGCGMCFIQHGIAACKSIGC